MSKYIRITTDREIVLKNGSKVNPIATLATNYGGRAQIYIDDHCYVLALIQKDATYINTDHIFKEAFEVLKTLPDLKNG